MIIPFKTLLIIFLLCSITMGQGYSFSSTIYMRDIKPLQCEAVSHTTVSLEWIDGRNNFKESLYDIYRGPPKVVTFWTHAYHWNDDFFGHVNYYEGFDNYPKTWYAYHFKPYVIPEPIPAMLFMFGILLILRLRKVVSGAVSLSQNLDEKSPERKKSCI